MKVWGYVGDAQGVEEVHMESMSEHICEQITGSSVKSHVIEQA